MNSFYEYLVELHQGDAAAFKAIIAGVLVSAVCGVMGCFIVLRRSAFLADAVAHSMLAGVVCGYLLLKVWLNRDAHPAVMLIGATIAGLITVLLVGFFSRFSRVKEDAIIGIMYTSIFSFGGVLASYYDNYIHVDLGHFLIGNLLGVSVADLWMIAIVAAIVLVIVILFFRPLQLVSFDPVMAASIGISVVAMEYVLTICTSMVVVTGVTVVGLVMVVGLLIIPGATAYLLSDRLSRMIPLAAGFGVSGFLIGYMTAVSLGSVAPGAAIVLACAAQFGLVFAFAPRYGFFADVIRRWNTTPQPLIEDVLGSILRTPNDRAEISEVIKHVNSPPHVVRAAIRALDRQDLLEVEGSIVILTPEGEREGRRLLRAHRLWEAYLAHVGAPDDELHDRAHQLEHLNDEDAVDYLDDKLGHPIVDPHGSVIPEDQVHLESGAIIQASFLRKGRSGVVTRLETAAKNKGLRVDMNVIAGPRQEDGAKWQLILPQGQGKILLTHDEADAVWVRLDEL